MNNSEKLIKPEVIRECFLKWIECEPRPEGGTGGNVRKKKRHMIHTLEMAFVGLTDLSRLLSLKLLLTFPPTVAIWKFWDCVDPIFIFVLIDYWNVHILQAQHQQIQKYGSLGKDLGGEFLFCLWKKNHESKKAYRSTQLSGQSNLL